MLAEYNTVTLYRVAHCVVETLKFQYRDCGDVGRVQHSDVV